MSDVFDSKIDGYKAAFEEEAARADAAEKRVAELEAMVEELNKQLASGMSLVAKEGGGEEGVAADQEDRMCDSGQSHVAVGIAQPSSSAGPSTSELEQAELLHQTVGEMGIEATFADCNEVVKKFPGDLDHHVNVIMGGYVDKPDEAVSELDSNRSKKLAKLHHHLR